MQPNGGLHLEYIGMGLEDYIYLLMADITNVGRRVNTLGAFFSLCFFRKHIPYWKIQGGCF